MNPLVIKKTNTTRFILPLLFDNTITFEKIINENFIDSYSCDFYEFEVDGCVIIIRDVDKEPTNIQAKLVKKYRRGQHFIFAYEIPEQWFVDHFHITKEKNFIITSPEYKDRIHAFWNEEQSKLTEVLLHVNKIDTKTYQFDINDEIYKVKPA